MHAWLTHPWPWYVTGPMIGLVVPMLLLIGNRSFGISSSLRHICAACIPARLEYFRYDWREQAWNLIFVAGIVIGGWVAMQWLVAPGTVTPVTAAFAAELARYHIDPHQFLLPGEIFGWQHMGSLTGLLMVVGGGMCVGFGARYAGGCTGGHAIMGLATLQRASLVATLAFLAGGFVMADLILPRLLG